MLFDLNEIQRYHESNPSAMDKYTAEIEYYDRFNCLASLDIFDSSGWYEALSESRSRGFTDDEKEIIVNGLKNILGPDYEKFIISHCTTSHDGGYDCWIMDIAFDIISEKGNDVDFIKWFSGLFLKLSEKEDHFIELEDLSYGLWRVWTWYDEERSKKLFSDLGLDVEQLIQRDADTDEAYYSSW